MFKIFGIPTWWAPILTVLILFLAHLALGANTDALAIIFTVVSYVLCLMCLTFVPQFKWIFSRTAFKSVMLLFLFTFIVIALQLSPFLPGGAHPFWSWLDSAKTVSLDQDATIHELLKFTGLGAVFVVGITFGCQDKRSTLFFDSLILAGALFSLWAFVTYIITVGAAPNGLPQNHARLAASFGSANSAAAVFGILSILSLASIIRVAKEASSKTSSSIFFYERLFRRSSLAIIALVLNLTALALTASRGGITSTLIVILILGTWELWSVSGQKNSSGKIFGVFMLAFSLIAFVFLISSDLFIDRLNNMFAVSNSRTHMLAEHWPAFKAAPWAGYGLGSFYLVNDTLMNAQNWRTLYSLGSMHNVYLQWLEETGIIGTSFIFSTIALILWHIYRGLRVRHHMHSWFRAILCISLLLLLHGMVDYGLQVPSIAMTWALLLGVGFGLATKRER